MRLQTRIAVLVATAVTVTAALVAVVVFLTERNELRAELDADLWQRSAAIAAQLPPPGARPANRPVEGVALPAYAQVVGADGRVDPLTDPAARLPVSPQALDVAARSADRFYTDAELAAGPVRVLTVPVPGGALQLGQPLRGVNSHLLALAGVLAATTAAGVSVAALLGLLVARAALRPVRRLSAGAERVTETRDLSTRLDVRGRDELSRLAATLNGMLEALEVAERSQRQLVCDASHELRTPLASMRTNLEVLEEAADLPPEDRDRLIADVRTELEGLISTVADLLDLAREVEQDHLFEELSLADVVEESVSRARRRFDGIRFRADLAPAIAIGNGPLLHRAIDNLLDNAAEWSPPGAEVHVVLSSERLTVHDRGPGIAPEDVEQVFERFYRSPTARGRPGSGLGLAIVRQVADAHGWRASAHRAEGGGTRLEIEFSTPDPATRMASRTTADPEGAGPDPAQARRLLPRIARTGAVLVLAAPLLIVVGVSLAGGEDEPRTLHTVTGHLERCADGSFCVTGHTVDFGPSWYVAQARARHDYDDDGRLGLLGEELAGLAGQQVTLETDGGRLDEDVYTLNGRPLRTPDGELPAPQAEPSPAEESVRLSGGG